MECFICDLRYSESAFCMLWYFWLITALKRVDLLSLRCISFLHWRYF